MDVLAHIYTEHEGIKEYTMLTPISIYQTRKKKWRSEQEDHIPLFHLSSISYSYFSPIQILFSALILLSVSIYCYYYRIAILNFDSDTILFIGIVSFIILVVLFFVMRRQIVVMSSNSKTIKIFITGGNKQYVKDFIDKVCIQQAGFLRNFMQ